MTEKSAEIFEARLCHVVKRADFDGYGFNLHAEKGRPGQYIGKVDEGSPSELAGLRQGDRIIEVNGVNIGSETHKQVVERIKSVANHTRLLVIDPKADIHNHQQLEAIERVKKSSNHADHENNNNIKHDEVETTKVTEVAENGNTNGTSATIITTMTTSTSETDSMQSNGSTPNESHPETQPESVISTTSITTTASKSLNLSMTAAEMRAQLKSKKRPDPKTETLDVRKKYEIIQKM